MSRFFPYDPNQAYLLPPNVKDVLGSEHLCFRLHAMIEQLEVSRFEEAYAAEGRLAYPPKITRLPEVELCDMGYRYSACSDGGTRDGLETVGPVCAAG